MGVKGLSTFVDNHPALLKDHLLRDTKVIIDGNNMLHMLYHRFSVERQFGGDYDEYGNIVRWVFNIFKSCNIEPIVVFDGALEPDGRKFSTTLKRCKQKLDKACNIYHGKPSSITPFLCRHVFIESLAECNVTYIQTDFEADDQMVILANQLNCPVMSNDSDFYVFDLAGGFVPFDYVSFVVSSMTDEEEADFYRRNKRDCVDTTDDDRRRNCSNDDKSDAKENEDVDLDGVSENENGDFDGDKTDAAVCSSDLGFRNELWSENSETTRGESNDVVLADTNDGTERKKPKGNRRKFLCCQLYHTSTFVEYFRLANRRHLYFIASISGNDYVDADNFYTFFSSLRNNLEQTGKPPQFFKTNSLIRWLRGLRDPNRFIEQFMLNFKQELRPKLEKLVWTGIRSYINVERQFDLKQLVELKKSLCKHRMKVRKNEEVDSSSPCKVETELRYHNGASISDWFVLDCRLAVIEPRLLTIMTLNQNIMSCQVEDMSKKSSNDSVLPIAQAIYAMICRPDKNGSLVITEYDRDNETVASTNVEVQIDDFSLPSLEQIPALSGEERLEVFAHVLQIDADVLSRFSSDLKLIAACLMFWIQNVNISDYQLKTLLVVIIYTFIRQRFRDKKKERSNKKAEGLATNTTISSERVCDEPTRDEDEVMDGLASGMDEMNVDASKTNVGVVEHGNLGPECIRVDGDRGNCTNNENGSSDSEAVRNVREEDVRDDKNAMNRSREGAICGDSSPVRQDQPEAASVSKRRRKRKKKTTSETTGDGTVRESDGTVRESDGTVRESEDQTNSDESALRSENVGEEVVGEVDLDKMCLGITQGCRDKLQHYLEALRSYSKFNKQSADMSIVHCMAQLQAIIHAVINLNEILRYPLEMLKISKYLNGTLFYKLSVRMKRKADWNVHIRQILGHNTVVYETYNSMLALLSYIPLPEEAMLSSAGPRKQMKISKSRNKIKKRNSKRK